MNYINENEEYNVTAFCNDCKMQFETRVSGRTIVLENVKCEMCKSSKINIIKENPVREVLME